jgi:uncharacterized protein (TIGR02328 family)
MRLWHQQLIPFLPRSQLLAQWRELNSIYAKEDQHILINYIYTYDKAHLYTYSMLIRDEFLRRGYTIRSFDKFNQYFDHTNSHFVKELYKDHHTDDYFIICFYNLYEKFKRGQKDFTPEQFEQMYQLYKEKSTALL